MDMSHKRRFYAGMVGGVVVLSWLVITSCSGKMANTDVSREADNSCYLCGNGGLMGYYGEFDSIGFMNVNTGQRWWECGCCFDGSKKAIWKRERYARGK